MGLGARLAAGFLFVVVVLGGATIYTGSAMIDGTVRREAQANIDCWRSSRYSRPSRGGPCPGRCWAARPRPTRA